MLTRLSIINTMLRSTGTAQLTAQDYQHPSYIEADAKLTEVLLEVLGRGWWFNSLDVVLKPDANGVLVIPSGALHCDPVDTTKNYAIRGLRLWDMVNNTDVISEDTECSIVYEFAVEDLPVAAALYVSHKARHDYYLDINGSVNKLDKYDKAQMRSFALLFSEDLKNRDVNALNGSGSTYWRTRRLPHGGHIQTR